MATLSQYIASQPRQTHDEWAKRFEVSRSRFTEIVSETCKSPPSVKLMLRIERETGGAVSLADWGHMVPDRGAA